MTRDPYRRSLVVFGGLVVAGFVALALAAAGAWRADDPATEVAYATSGGGAGLGLVGTGLAVLGVQRRRWAAARDRHDLRRLAEAAMGLVVMADGR